MEISVIASGSNGNCCLVQDKNTSILIDAGKSGKEIEARANQLGKNIENVDGIIITHSHSDHISGAGVLSRRYGIPVYMTRNAYNESIHKIGTIKKKIFDMNKSFKINKLEIKPIITSHKVSSCGFKIKDFGLFTDTGVVTKQMETAIPKLKTVLLESNHDIDMVINGPYPAFLKNWILSDIGHLSNIYASTLLQKKGKNLNLALLGHLSGNNNSIDIAKETFETLVKRKMDYHVCSREQQSGNWEI